MQKERIRQFLNAVGCKVSQAQNRKKWVVATCPFAPWKHDGGIDRHPSFAVKIKEGGKSMYNCFSCSSHGDLSDMVLELRTLTGENTKGYDFKTALQLIANEEDDFDLDIKDYKEPDQDENPYTIFPEWWLDSFESARMFKAARKYLSSRGIYQELSEDLDLRYDPVRKRICFPVRDFDGFLVGMYGRDITGKQGLRYYSYGFQEQRNPVAWLGESWVDLDKPLVLCEGPFDLASIYRVYRNVMCSFSASMGKRKVKRIRDAGEIITLYDHGKGGDIARDTLDKYHKGLMTHLVPSAEQDDAGNMTVEEIEDALQIDDIL